MCYWHQCLNTPQVFIPFLSGNKNKIKSLSSRNSPYETWIFFFSLLYQIVSSNLKDYYSNKYCPLNKANSNHWLCISTIHRYQRHSIIVLFSSSYSILFSSEIDSWLWKIIGLLWNKCWQLHAKAAFSQNFLIFWIPSH